MCVSLGLKTPKGFEPPRNTAMIVRDIVDLLFIASDESGLMRKCSRCAACFSLPSNLLSISKCLGALGCQWYENQELIRNFPCSTYGAAIGHTLACAGDSGYANKKIN